jgi:hypothetical protein
MNLFSHSGVGINSSFQRSTRIDNKISKNFLDHFIFHDTSKKVLDQIANSISNTNQSAFTLTGPYGTGKSSLGLFFKALLSQDNKIRKQAEKIANYNSKHLFSKTFLKKKWFILNLIGSKQDPIISIAEQIDETIKNKWITKGIPSCLKTRTKPTVAGVIKSLNNLSNELNKKNYGLIFIIDEMGKLLDFASSVGSDLNLFQEIAENFSNIRLNKEGNPIFIGILHQPFEEYARSLGRTVEEEWQKIQGRFEDIPFTINPEETVHLISHAINHKSKDNNFSILSEKISKIINNGKNNKTLFEALSNCNPVHPLVALLLNPISRQRFGQNERSIFTFLNSGEPNGFLNFLGNSKNKKNLYTLDLLFDYLQMNLEPSILVSNIGHLWAEAAESIRRAEALDDKESIKLAKIISLIDLFGKNISLFSSKEVLENSLNSNKLSIILKNLEDKKVIIYRKFKKAYSLYSGSDINLNEVTELNKSKIANDYDIILSQLPNLQPIIAKRHFFKTGTQRIFQRFCLVLSNVKKTVEDIIQLDISNVSAGAFVFLCKSKEDSKSEFKNKINEISNIKFPKPIIVGTSERYVEFFNHALEIAALKRVRSTVSAIEGDAIAKKELSGRLTAYQNLLFNSLYVNFENANWKFNNNKIKASNLSSIASEVSEQVYKLTPIVHNELIVRDKLSTNAVNASLCLIDRILNNSSTKNLAMEGYPAEFGLYLSIIKKNNLHKKISNEYKFVSPNKKIKELKSLYEDFIKLIKSKNELVPISELYTLFTKQPYGLKKGLVPILLATFIKINEGLIALYSIDEQQTETLITEYSNRVCERFIYTPESLKIMYVKIEGEKEALLNDFKNYVETKYLNGKKIENPTPLNVLKPIVVRVYNLPAFARKTRSFKDKRTLALRDELLSTKNPYELLYKKIPEICNCDDLQKLVKEFDKVYSELDKVYINMISNFKKVIVKVFKSDPNISDINFETIKAWCKKIGSKDPFSSKSNDLPEDKWLEQIISYAASKPANEWNDNDYNEAILKIEEMVRHFIMSYRLYTLREKHSDTKIIDIAIFEGKSPERSSKFYKFDSYKNKSVDKISQEVLNLLEGQNLNESEKGEVVLKVLRKIMNFKNSNEEKLA